MDGAVVSDGAVLTRSIVGRGASVGTGAELADAVLGDGCRVGAHCELRFGARVWPEVVLPDAALRFSSDV
jgi:mannose-1-phosphate guanylyltransferase